MRFITIILASLLFSLIDYRIGLESVRLIYGNNVYLILNEIPFNILYFIMIFSIELLVFSSLFKIFKFFIIKRKTYS